jgi:hypothetical protein
MPLWWSNPTSSHAFILSLVSIVITLIAAIVGIIGYTTLDDSLILIYGLENVVDFFSSAIVLWRFNDHSSSSSSSSSNTMSVGGDEEQQTIHNDILLKREKRASIGVSIVLAILGFGGTITSIEDLIKGVGEVIPQNMYTLFMISIISIFVFGTLATFKFHYATILNSPSLRKDGVCSAIGAILGVAMFFNSLLAMADDDQFWWFLDPFVALLCGVGALSYGLYGMHKAYVKDGYPIFSCKWWLYGGGTGSSTGSSNAGNSINGSGINTSVAAQREIGGGGELELRQEQQQAQHQQQSNTSLQVNPTLTNPSVSMSAEHSYSSNGISMMKSKSGDADEDMSDIVIT